MDILRTLLDNILANRHLIVSVLAFYLAAYVTIRRANRPRGEAERLWDLLAWLGLGALVGGRLGAVIMSPLTYLTSPALLLRVDLGMTFYGALAGGFLAAVIGARRVGLAVGEAAVWFTPLAPLAMALDRLGCVVAFESCMGQATAGPLGIVLQGSSIARFPSQLLEGFAALLVVAAVLWIQKRRAQSGSESFLVGISGYALVRSVINLTRIGYPDSWLLVDMAIGLVIVSGATMFLVARWRKQGEGLALPVETTADAADRDIG